MYLITVQAGAPDIGYSDGLGLWYYGVTGTDDFYTPMVVYGQTDPITAGQTWTFQSYSAFSKSGPLW